MVLLRKRFPQNANLQTAAELGVKRTIEKEIMNKEIEIWNILHDGVLTAFPNKDKSLLTIFVHIPYLRKRIEPVGVCFVLKLSGVKSCRFFDFDGKEEDFNESLNAMGIEILSAGSIGNTAMPVEIQTSLGTIILEYENIGLFLESGNEVSLETIAKASTEYWQEWSKKTKA